MTDQIERDIGQRFSRILFSNQENGVRHNPYDEEVREFLAIEQGDRAQLEKSIAERYSGSIGRLACDPVRHAQNLAIVVITLASRAAMRGGLEPEIAYSLSDSYIQKTEEIHSPESLARLMRSAEYRYTDMVHELQERRHAQPDAWHEQNGTGRGVGRGAARNPHVEACRAYIVAHLHDKLTVSGIAATLNINANYLSELFTASEGMTVIHFISLQRIETAKDLLRYSSYSCGEISEYLCFATQSHFCRRFREQTGYTPFQFRNKFGVLQTGEQQHNDGGGAPQ